MNKITQGTKNTALLLTFIFLIGIEAVSQQISITPVSKLNSPLDRVNSISFSPQSDLVVASDKKGNIHLWDLDELKSIGHAKVGGSILKVEFIKENEILVIQENGTLTFLNSSDLSELNKTLLKEKIKNVSIDPNKKFLSYVNTDNELNIYSLSANMLQSSIDLSNRLKNTHYLGYDRFGQQLVVVAENGTTVLCNPLNQKIIKELKLRSDEFQGSASVIQSVGSSKGSELFVVGVQEVFIPKGGIQGGQPERRNSILTYDWDTSQEMKRIRVNNTVDNLVLGPGPGHITYYSKKKFEVTIVDLAEGSESSQITMESFPEALEISEDDSYLAAGDKNGALYLYSLDRNSAPEIKIVKPNVIRGYGDVIIEKENFEVKGVLSDNTKIKNITVNGISANILNNGQFSSNVNLVPGKNKIRIVAEDFQSNHVLKDIYLTRNPASKNSLPVNNLAIHKQKRIALVIGNADYEGSGQLINTVNDAKTMAKTLEGLNFEVSTILNGSYEDIKNAVFEFGHDIIDVDVSLFFYAGHGLEIEGINYLVPVDAHLNSVLDVKQRAIPLTGVINTVKYANDDGLNMIILDACRNNPFPTGKRGGAGLGKSSAPSGTIIAYSTSPGSVASDGTGENGLYTGELVKQLVIPQRIEDVFMRTRNNVEEISEGAQQPWEEARLKGIFYISFEDE